MALLRTAWIRGDDGTADLGAELTGGLLGSPSEYAVLDRSGGLVVERCDRVGACR